MTSRLNRISNSSRKQKDRIEMLKEREIILEKVSEHIAKSLRKEVDIREDAYLIDLGVDSMGVITTLLMLEKEIGLNFDSMIDKSPPKTLGDLVGMATNALIAGQSEGQETLAK